MTRLTFHAKLWLITGIALLGIVGFLLWRYQIAPTEPGYENYKWVDTKYAGIRTKVVQKSTAHNTAIVEYIETGNNPIDTTINTKADSFVAEFQKDSDELTRLFGGKAEQNVSYQIVRNTPTHLSVVVTATQLAPSSHPEHQTAYWTFSKITGRAVTLDDIFGQANRDGIPRLEHLVRTAIDAKLRANHSSTTMDIANEFLASQPLSSFLTADAASLRFDFAQGEVGAESDGDISVTIPTDTLQLFLQTPTARQLFTVSPVSNAPIFATADAKADCRQRKCIALTFDDGPSQLTAGLLDQLAQKKAHATFFIIGSLSVRRASTIERQVREGHTVANHTWSHTSMTKLSVAAMEKEIIATNQALEKITGTKPSYLRPPNAAINKNVYAALAAQDMTGVLWSVDTRDWADKDATIIYNRVVASARPGAIVVLHDIHRPTIEAVPRIIDTLSKQGYVFVSLDELFGKNVKPGQIVYKAA